MAQSSSYDTPTSAPHVMERNDDSASGGLASTAPPTLTRGGAAPQRPVDAQ